MKRIQNKLHRIGTYDVCKISLSCLDDKRSILDNNINSLACFHKDILKNESDCFLNSFLIIMDLTMYAMC